jgi:hypothetical protein
MPQTQPPPEGLLTRDDALPKREYHAPELQDLGTVSDATAGSGSSGTYDGPGYSS